MEREHKLQKVGEVIGSSGAMSSQSEYYLGKIPKEDIPLWQQFGDEHVKVTYTRGWSGEVETCVTHQGVHPIVTRDVTD